MFERISRYRQVPDIAVVDARGRVVAAKDSRPLPAVTGTFPRTVVAGDRLDGLAATYYGQPLFYWHICDANPAELSPLSLLADGAVATTVFPLSVPAGPPPWAELIRRLSTVVGVEQVAVTEDAVPGRQDLVTMAVTVTYNRLTVEAKTLSHTIAEAGFTPGAPADHTRVGQRVVIPPAVNG